MGTFIAASLFQVFNVVFGIENTFSQTSVVVWKILCALIIFKKRNLIYFIVVDALRKSWNISKLVSQETNVSESSYYLFNQ